MRNVVAWAIFAALCLIAYNLGLIAVLLRELAAR